MSRKIWIGLLAVSTVCLLAPRLGSALDLGLGQTAGIATNAGYSANTTQTTFSETLGTVVKAALSLAGVIFMSLMVYAGYLWMTARGDESKIESSQNIIRSSVIGLIITVGAYSITAFVLPRILAKTTGSSGEQGTVGTTGQGDCRWTITIADTIANTTDNPFAQLEPDRTGSAQVVLGDCRARCQRAAVDSSTETETWIYSTCTFNGNASF